MLSILLSSALPWLAAAGAGLALLVAAYARGRGDRSRDLSAERDRAALHTRETIDEAVRNAPTEPDAARRALAERLRRESRRE